MGDRCYLTLRCRPQDVAVIEQEFGGATSTEPWEGYRHLEFEDVNYGGSTELQRLCARNIPFEGNHTAGDDYGAAAFACADGDLVEVPVDACMNPVVSTWEGEPLPEDLALVRRYEALRKRVLAILFDTTQEEVKNGR